MKQYNVRVCTVTVLEATSIEHAITRAVRKLDLIGFSVYDDSADHGVFASEVEGN